MELNSNIRLNKKVAKDGSVILEMVAVAKNTPENCVTVRQDLMCRYYTKIVLGEKDLLKMIEFLKGSLTAEEKKNPLVLIKGEPEEP
jgi:hypothetical protein